MWFPSLSHLGKSASRKRSRQRLPKTARRTTQTARPAVEALEDRCLLSAGVIPDDPRFVQQWGLEVTEAPRAWEITTGSTRVTVAVVDTGIDYTHPDLYKNIWINQDEIPRDIRRDLVDVDGDRLITFWDLNEPVNQGPGKITDLNGTGFIDGGDLIRPVAAGGWADGRDDGHNGYVDDLVGYDFLANDNDPMDGDITGFGHGTFAAGIIGAVGNNGVGVTGINWKTQIMPLRFAFHSTTGEPKTPAQQEAEFAAILAAGRYAIDNGARIVQGPPGGRAANVPPERRLAVSALVDEAARRNILIVAAAGNLRTDLDVDPTLLASLPQDNFLIVAATDRNDRLADFPNLNGLDLASNFGATTVDLGAPGKDVWSTLPASFYPGLADYGQGFGTSWAAPHVAGTAALILSVNPNLSYAEVRDLILHNVDVVPDLVGKTVTGGRLNIFKAVRATPLPLVASSVGTSAPTESLTREQVTPLFAEAVARWQATGAYTSGLSDMQVIIADLGGATLGMAAGNTIWLDANAAGWGWFVDPTPGDDSEFTTPGDQGEQHRMDLLTVLAHEIGHLLGHEHEDEGVMEETLTAGTRLTLLDAAFSDADWLVGLPDLVKKRDRFIA
ncbi:MAG: S8 family serine peptidase [Gemmataceae bacterium]|nr:S8 family serine peptidase [Gemmataceae bacterium]